MNVFNTSRLSREHVKGVLCADEAGLNICSRGTLINAAGNAAVDLMKLASSLEPDLSMSSIVIELTGFFQLYSFFVLLKIVELLLKSNWKVLPITGNNRIDRDFYVVLNDTRDWSWK